MAIQSERFNFLPEYQLLYRALHDGNNKIIKVLQENGVDIIDIFNYDSKTAVISEVRTYSLTILKAFFLW